MRKFTNIHNVHASTSYIHRYGENELTCVPKIYINREKNKKIKANERTRTKKTDVYEWCKRLGRHRKREREREQDIGGKSIKELKTTTTTKIRTNSLEIINNYCFIQMRFVSIFIVFMLFCLVLCRLYPLLLFDVVLVLFYRSPSF